MNASLKKLTVKATYLPLLYPERLLGQVAGRRFVDAPAPTPDEYLALLALLTHRKPRVRWMAASRLGKLAADGRAAEPLLTALTDSHWMVRLHAVKALGSLGSLTGIEPLVATLQDRCHYVRRAAMIALSRRKSDKDPLVTEALLRLLRSPDEGAQIDAIRYLSKRPSPAVVDALAATIRDHADPLSREIMNAFARIGVLATVALDRLLEHPSPELRFHAAIILGYRGHQRAIGYLEATLASADPELRRQAAFYLGEFRKSYRAR
jgi:HEAT repeat protein